jgi:uncharacterized protein (DUF983 family)
MSTTTPSRSRMMTRGVTRRCPRCGSGQLFHKWFKMVPDCPRCGLHFEREEGYWTGAIAVNTIVIGAVFAVVFITAMVLTVPTIPWAPILAAVLPIMAIGPFVVYPFSKTIWVAIDLGFLQPLGISLGGD